MADITVTIVRRVETMSRKWKEFERIVAEIQRSLSSSAIVTQNEKIRGKNSGVLREVDICVRERIAQFEILVAISCKDHAVALDVTEVEAFAASLEDIGANKGAMVAANGFTQAAKAVAARKGIDLYRLVDTEHLEWASYISIPTLVRNLNLKWRVVFEGAPEALEATRENHETIIYLQDGVGAGTVRQVVMDMWKTGRIPERPGEYHMPDITLHRVHVKGEEGLLPIRIQLDALVSFQWFLGTLPLTAVRALTNEADGSLKIQHMQTDWLRFEDLQQWQQVENPTELATKPILVFDVKDAPPGDPDAMRSVRLRIDDARVNQNEVK